MWARVASFEDTDVTSIRDEVRQPPAEVPPGLRGFMSLVDESSGRQLFLTLFDSFETMEAAESWFERMGDEIPEQTRGRRVAKAYWEVAGGALMLA
jgi:hypothetical protein